MVTVKYINSFQFYISLFHKTMGISLMFYNFFSRFLLVGTADFLLFYLSMRFCLTKIYICFRFRVPSGTLYFFLLC